MDEQVIILGGRYQLIPDVHSGSSKYNTSDKVNFSSMLIRLYDKIGGLQVLQYNKHSATWTEIGKMGLKRHAHALSTFCTGRKKIGTSLAALSLMTTTITIVIIRPKPHYGRQGLAGSWGKDKVRQVYFGVFSMAFSSDWMFLFKCGLQHHSDRNITLIIAIAL